MVCNAQVFCTLYNLANKWINCMLSSIVRSESCWWTRNDRKSYLLKPYTGLQHKLDELQFISTLEKQNPTLQHKHWNQQHPHIFWLFKTVLAHALIVSPWPSRPGWARQSVLWREVGLARRVTLPQLTNISHLMSHPFSGANFLLRV